MEEVFQSKDLNLKFKGPRNYLHGTDMYREITALIHALHPGDGGRFRLTIHDIVHTQCRLLHADADLPPPDGAKVEFHYDSDAAHCTGWLVETKDPVKDRVEYDEDSITRNCTVEGKRVTFRKETPNSSIEVLVAINKKLHQTLYPDEPGKWYFTRLDLHRLLRPDDKAGFELDLVQNLRNRLTKSRIRVDGMEIGFIYFSAVRR